MSSTTTAHFAHPSKNTDLFGIEPGMTVVDFGSGSGHYVLEMADRLQHSGHVYAIDIQKDLLTRVKNEAHKRGHTNVEIIWGDLERRHASKIADEHVDLVLISNLLFQLEHKAAALEEAMRILKPRGRLVIIDWSDSFGGLGPTRKRVLKREEAHEIAERAGFRFVEEFDAGAHHYGLVFVKAHRV